MSQLEAAINAAIDDAGRNVPLHATGPTRYKADPKLGFVEDADGAYMLHADHVAILNRTAPPNSIEELADVTLDRIAEFFGKCVNQPEFCGFSVEEAEDAFHNPVSLTLTACEQIGGEPMRKVAK